MAMYQNVIQLLQYKLEVLGKLRPGGGYPALYPVHAHNRDLEMGERACNKKEEAM
jgi:hypothetical protein